MTPPPWPQPEGMDFTADSSRWRVLLTLASLNLISDWTCFSVAPIAEYAEKAFTDLRPSVLVAVFLVANVCATLSEPWLLGRFGLRRIVVAAAAAMVAGNLLKAGIPVLAPNRSSALVLAGFAVVGAAQPFFQVTTVATIQNWLPVSERTLGTMIALNANQVGIGLAYIVGAKAVTSAADVVPYFQLLTLLSALALAAAATFFRSRPAHPPSASAAAKRPRAATAELENNDDEDHNGCNGFNGCNGCNGCNGLRKNGKRTGCGTFLEVSRNVLALFEAAGFWHTLLVFCTAVGVTNVVATFLAELMEGIGHDSFIATGLLGAIFQLTVAASGTAVGVLNDRLHAYYQTAVVLLCAATATLAAVAVCFRNGSYVGLWVALPLLGAAVGPLKPLMTDLGVDVVFPRDENDVLFVQQITCNVASTLLILLFDAVADATSLKYLSALYVMAAVVAAALLLFAGTFNGQYLRLKFDVGNSLRSKAISGVEDGSESGSGAALVGPELFPARGSALPRAPAAGAAQDAGGGRGGGGGVRGVSFAQWTAS